MAPEYIQGSTHRLKIHSMGTLNVCTKVLCQCIKWMLGYFNWLTKTWTCWLCWKCQGSSALLGFILWRWQMSAQNLAKMYQVNVNLHVMLVMCAAWFLREAMERTRDIRIDHLGTMNVWSRCCDIYWISESLNLQVVLKEMLRIVKIVWIHPLTTVMAWQTRHFSLHVMQGGNQR